MCERELKTEQNCNILTPTLMAITVFLSRSPGLLNRGPGGPALCWELVPTAQTGTLTSSSELQRIWTSCRWGYIIVLRPPNSTRRQSRPSPDPLISSTGCTCYLHRCISFDSLAGSEVNMQHTEILSKESTKTTNRCPRGVMVKAMNCGIVVREFVLQSRYYVHFRANTLGKGMNPLILPPAMGK